MEKETQNTKETKETQNTKETVEITNIEFAEFEDETKSSRIYITDEIERLAELKLNVKALLGTRLATVGEIKNYEIGDILEIERMDGHNVDIYVGDEIIAIGEVIPMDSNFGLAITEVLDAKGNFLKKVRKNGDIA